MSLALFQDTFVANEFQIGGSSLLLDLDVRLSVEMMELGHDNARVHALETRRLSVRIGASKFASQAEFFDMMVTLAEYEEWGSRNHIPKMPWKIGTQ